MSQRKLITLACAGALSLGLVAGLGACATTPPTESETPTSTEVQPYEFTDDLGNAVVVESIDRVVACMGSFANLWELAGGTLVGVSDDAFQQYTIASPDVTMVGDFTAPNLEQIIGLEPDFVIMTGATTGKDGSAGQVDLRDGLVAAGIPVAYFKVTTFPEYLKMLKTLTEITGRDDLYTTNGADVQAQIDAIIADQAKPATPPTVLLMTTYSGGTRVQNSATMTGAMLADLGVTNLADQNPSLLKDFSLEAVIAANPDYILVVPMGNDPEAATKALEEMTAANPAWATLDAVKNGRYQTLDPALFLYKPNARWAESYQTLSDILAG